LDIETFEDPTYNYKFNNEIVKGSFLIEDILVDQAALTQYIEDDSNGNIVLVKTVNDQTTRQNIGTINYDVGEISFSINFLQDDLTFVMSVEPTNENFYVYNNKYVYINQASYKQLDLYPNKSF